MRKHILAVSALVLSASYLGTSGRAAVAATRSVAQALCALGYSSIPLRTLPTGHHVVDVTVNGRRANFMVDTGAGGTVIHRDYASAFGLQTNGGRAAKAVSAGGVTAAKWVAVKEFTIAGTRTALSAVYTLDLSHFVNATVAMVGGPVHGIIGHDILRTQHAIIDVQQERLYLKPLEGEQQTGC